MPIIPTIVRYQFFEFVMNKRAKFKIQSQSKIKITDIMSLSYFEVRVEIFILIEIEKQRAIIGRIMANRRIFLEYIMVTKITQPKMKNIAEYVSRSLIGFICTSY
jgi:hypothetical protein